MQSTSEINTGKALTNKMYFFGKMTDNNECYAEIK